MSDSQASLSQPALLPTSDADDLFIGLEAKVRRAVELVHHLRAEKAQISFQLHPETKERQTLLNDEVVDAQLRTQEVNAVVSEVSAIKVVRTAMVAQQQRIAKGKGVVMDGRDIGTARIRRLIDVAGDKLVMNDAWQCPARHRAVARAC